MKLLQLLKDYKDLEKEIYNYFSFEENWRVYPIEDSTQSEWSLTYSEIVYSNNLREDYKNEANYFGGALYSANSIYRTELYTGIIIDTECDGNIFFMIFDNAKEIKDLENDSVLEE